jgi:hypothetical protein
VPYADAGTPARRLGRQRSACQRPAANGRINAVYQHAIEVTGFMSGTKGMGVFGGGLALIGLVVLLNLAGLIVEERQRFGLLDFVGGTILAVAIAGAGLAALAFFRVDLFALRDEPVLFNRDTGKVHLFRRRMRWSRPWVRWPVVIDTYDWDCICGEVRGGAQLVGGSLPALRYRLLAAVSQRAEGLGSKIVIDRFHIGREESSQDDCVALWEHIRRYMEEGGPVLQPGDVFNPTRGFSHRRALANGGLWVLQPGFYGGFWRKPAGKVLGTLAQLVTLPVTLSLACARWLAEITSRTPRWPADVLAQAGGDPLAEQDVLASIVSARPEPDAGSMHGAEAGGAGAGQARTSAARREPGLSDGQKAVLTGAAILAAMAVVKLYLHLSQGGGA